MTLTCAGMGRLEGHGHAPMVTVAAAVTPAALSVMLTIIADTSADSTR